MLLQIPEKEELNRRHGSIQNSVYPLFSGEEQNKILWGGSGFVRSRLVYNITPAGLDVKGGEAVYFTLDLQILAVLLRHTLRKKHGQLSVNPAPILPPTSPFFGDVYHCQVQHFQ